MKPWKRIEPTETTKVGWRTVVTKHFVNSRGQTVEAGTVAPEGTSHTGVIAITTDKRVVVAQQFRAGPEQIMLEIPGGTVEAGERPEAAVKRELLEEVGYLPGNITYLGKVYKGAWHNAEWHYFLATACESAPNGAHPDEFEEIEIKTISIEDLISNAKNARMTDVEAVLLAYDELLELKSGK